MIFVATEIVKISIDGFTSFLPLQCCGIFNGHSFVLIIKAIATVAIPMSTPVSETNPTKLVSTIHCPTSHVITSAVLLDRRLINLLQFSISFLILKQTKPCISDNLKDITTIMNIDKMRDM